MMAKRDEKGFRFFERKDSPETAQDRLKCRVLMKDGKWLVPAKERPKLAGPPKEQNRNNLSSPERANFVW